MIRYIAPLVAFALLVAVFIKGLDPERDLNELPSPFLGKEAPTFDLSRVRKPEDVITSYSIHYTKLYEMLDEHGNHVLQLVQRVEIVLVAEALQDRLQQFRCIGALATDNCNGAFCGFPVDVFLDERRFAGLRGPLEQAEPGVVLVGLVKELPGRNNFV